MTHTSPVDLPEIPGARHLGDLGRGTHTWRVYFETSGPGRLVKGRLHFVGSEATRSTGWIFVEWSEGDLLKRFQEFSALELWKLVESLA